MAGSGGRGKSGTATAQRSTGVVVPEGVDLTDGPGGRRYTFSQGDNNVAFTVYSGDNSASVSLSVNGSLDRTDVSRRDGIALALRTRSIMRAEAASRPDGFRFTTSATTEDGLGAIRARLYNQVGFTAAARPGDSQYGVVRNGRLVPDTGVATRRAAANASSFNSLFGLN